VLGDVQDSDSSDGTQSGYDSPTLFNHISGTGDSFQSLLEEIHLRGNRLTNIPSWLFFRFPFLRCVDASQNRLEGLPAAVWACTSLVELNVSENRLSSLSCVQSDSAQLQIDGDVDQRPGTPASTTSEGSASFDITAVISTTDQEHSSVSVHHLERWRDRVDVRPVSYLGGTSERCSQVEHRKSRLKELDLSHNDFDEVPSVLPCVAPSLERLNLSHNRLTRFGPVDCFPAALRLLDLSHNRISVMDLTEDGRGLSSSLTTPVSIPSPSAISFTSRLCYSPFFVKRSVIYMNLYSPIKLDSNTPAQRNAEK